MSDPILSQADELVLGGVLRFATRFDGLDDDARRVALAAAATEVGGLATETRRVESERAGYRDAAMVVQVVATNVDLQRILARAEAGFPTDRDLRAAILALDRPRVQVAIVHAVEALARHSGVTRSEELFLDWLRSTWRMPPST